MKFSEASKLKKHLSIAFLLILYVGVLAYLSRYIM
ncbi:hypothetical protein M272_19090 [Vibrio natriegens NBRC 15636 = ATCC 14048 = DSM 759]|nr:hypothetical protein M272_19090 [Vibrio natriegens NBRC 15636 = ATCC 14048 = DSM 759]CAH0528187.1 hypothetical protein CTH30272_01861 [Catenococcus thiocycli]